MLGSSVHLCQRFGHVSWSLVLGPLLLFSSASGARTNVAGIKAAMMHVSGTGEIRQENTTVAETTDATSHLVGQTSSSGFAVATESFKPMSLSFQIAIIGLVVVVSGSLLTFSEKRNKDGDGYSIGIGNQEIDEYDGDTYRSLACLVCSWATCRLSLPVLLYSWQKAPLKPILFGLESHDDALPAATLQVAVFVGLLCCLVCQHCSHALSQLFCPIVASLACVAIEWLVISPPSSAYFFSFPLGLLIGSGVCMHVNAMCLAVQHAANYWVLPLSLLIYAGIANGFVDLQRQHENLHSNLPGAASEVIGLYGTWALKFAIIGLMCSAQLALYASPVQKNIGRTTFGVAEFLRKGEGMLLSWKFGLALLLQATPICLNRALFIFLPKLKASNYYRNAWEDWSLYMCLGAWGVVYPVWVTYCFPTSHHNFVIGTCMAILGVIAVLDAELMGKVELNNPWAALVSGVTLALSVSAVLVEMVIDGEAVRSIKEESESCSKPVDFPYYHGRIIGHEMTTSPVHTRSPGCCEKMENSEITDSSLIDASTYGVEEEPIDKDFRKPHVFEDPLAALFAPDVDDCDN